MPKKKGGMPFVMHPTPAKGKDGKILYYLRPLNGMKKTMEELDEWTKGDNPKLLCIFAF